MLELLGLSAIVALWAWTDTDRSRPKSAPPSGPKYSEPTRALGSGAELCLLSIDQLQAEIERLENQNLEPGSIAFLKAASRCDELEYAISLRMAYGNRAYTMWPTAGAIAQAREEIKNALRDNDQLEFTWSPFTKGEAIIASQSPSIMERRVSDLLTARGLPPGPMHEPLKPETANDIDLRWCIDNVAAYGAITRFCGPARVPFVVRLAARMSHSIDVAIFDIDQTFALQMLRAFGANLNNIRMFATWTGELPARLLICQDREVAHVPDDSCVLMLCERNHPEAWKVTENRITAPWGDQLEAR